MLHHIQNLIQELDLTSLSGAVQRVLAVVLCLSIHESAHGLAAYILGDRTAEQIKINIGAVYEHKRPKQMKVKGRDLSQGLPREIVLSSTEMLEALIDPISEILDGVCAVIERTPPELVGDILQNGIMMTGGGSMVYGLDKLITEVTGIRTRVAENPVSCVAIGTGEALEHLGNIPEGAVNFARNRR